MHISTKLRKQWNVSYIFNEQNTNTINEKPTVILKSKAKLLSICNELLNNAKMIYLIQFGIN